MKTIAVPAQVALGMMEEKMNSKISAKKLTVIIRDDAPMIHCNDVSSYRRVTINLTDDQQEKLRLFATSTSMGKDVFESYSKCFLEDKDGGKDE